jgi:phosphoribosylglycinamide formyltransferase 1
VVKEAKVGILVGTRGRGSNMRALIEACRAGKVPNAEVSVVVAPTEAAPALEVARELGVATRVAPNEAGALLEAFEGCDAICLAGFLRLLPAEVLTEFPDRILNIHPALLPKFGGKGMYGQRVHEAVIDAQETESGCTVHLVNERYDEGRIVLQKRCPVFPDDTPETLAARVLSLEHQAFPEALAEVLRGR